jgi:hypothetical protein
MTINGPVIPKRYLFTGTASPTPSASSPSFTTGEIVTCLRTGRAWIVGNDGTNPAMNPIAPEFSSRDAFDTESVSGIAQRAFGSFPFTSCGTQIYGAGLRLVSAKNGSTNAPLQCGDVTAAALVGSRIDITGAANSSVTSTASYSSAGNITITGGKCVIGNNSGFAQTYYQSVNANFGVESGVDAGSGYSLICNMSNTKCDMKRIVEANAGVSIPSILSANALGTSSSGTVVPINPSNRIVLDGEMNATGNLTATNTGTSAATTYGSSGTGAYQTIGLQTTGITSTGRAAVGTASVTSVILGQGTTECTAFIKLTQLSATAQAFVYRFGFLDNLDGTVADGVFFEYTDASPSTTPNWMAHSYANSVGVAATDTGVAASAVNWVKLKIVVNAAATSASYYINDSLVATRTAAIPSGTSQITGFYAVIRKTNGTSAVTASVDYMGMTMEVTR